MKTLVFHITKLYYPQVWNCLKMERLFISVRDSDKKSIRDIVEIAENLGFELVATEGTANAI